MRVLQTVKGPSRARRAHLQPMKRAQRGPSSKVSGPKGLCEPNRGGPEWPTGKVSGPKNPFTTNGEGTEGLNGKVSGPFTTNERAQRGPSGKVLFACFFIFHCAYATFMKPLTVLLTTRRGPFRLQGGAMAPLPPPWLHPCRQLPLLHARLNPLTCLSVRILVPKYTSTLSSDGHNNCIPLNSN